MNAEIFSVRHNVMSVSSISAFSGITGGLNCGCKDVYFLLGIGCSASYLSEIERMDRLLLDRQAHGRGRYQRLNELPKLCQSADIAACCAAYDRWKLSPDQPPDLPLFAQNGLLRAAFFTAFSVVNTLYRRHTPHATDSTEKNFMTKLFFWVDRALSPLLNDWQPGFTKKFVYSGPVKKQEFLFCYLLTLLGVDVLILAPEGRPDLEKTLLELSGELSLGANSKTHIPPLSAATSSPVANGSTGKVNISREGREQAGVSVAVSATASVCTVLEPAVPSTPIRVSIPPPPGRERNAATARQELEYEQLAQLASSIVMIEVSDPNGNILSSGSGIMIGAEGYILTNHHVACRGTNYLIHIEEDQTVYRTNEIIKTHALLDLALIRVERKLRPLPIYQQTAPLVRGQRVVAIGSPLGLFNSVSDGIIAGFRNIHEVDMIQFTAPISPGSSGGAVLNLFGEVIGISTAGIDNGQNLNLAVGYQSILPFIRGFVK